MHTTRTETKAVVFLHDGRPDNGDLKIVINSAEAQKFNIQSEFDQILIETDKVLDQDYVTITLPYNMIRDFVLGKLRDREISKLEQMDADDLVYYYSGSGD